MYKVKEIAEAIEKLAPKEIAESWDNVGLMVGDYEQEVERVYICLDVTSENIRRAVECGADMIISHHPLIFSPLKRVVEDDVSGSIIRTLIKKDISVYSAHTNLDKADGGMNDVLAEKLGLENIRHFTNEECEDRDNIGRIGVLDSPAELADFVSLVRSILGCRSIRYVGAPMEEVNTVAVCSGSGGDGIYTAYRAGADVYVTSDVRHHEAQLAFELGINLVDAGHFETENIVCEFMREYISECFPGLNVFCSDAEPYLQQ